MAKISNIPKVGEFYILGDGHREIDFQITSVVQNCTLGGHATLTIEGFPHRERQMVNSVSYPSSGLDGYVAFTGTTGTIPPYQSVTIQPNQAIKQMKFKNDKGMTVDINTIETVDGIKAQIVLYAGSKKVIAWESEAFEDDEDLSAKGAQTGDVKAKKAAEGHAKSVLKALFSQS